MAYSPVTPGPASQVPQLASSCQLQHLRPTGACVLDLEGAVVPVDHRRRGVAE